MSDLIFTLRHLKLKKYHIIAIENVYHSMIGKKTKKLSQHLYFILSLKIMKKKCPKYIQNLSIKE